MFFPLYVLTIISICFKHTAVGVSDNPSDNCTGFRDEFAASVSSYVSCSILHSRPITFCEKCVDVYIEVQNNYSILITVIKPALEERCIILQSKDDRGPCIDNFVNLDRLQIINSLYSNMNDIWNRAKCYECFKFEQGILTHNLSTETITFNKLLMDLKQCINSTDVNITTMCSQCLDTYETLSLYYDSISNENEKIGVCMDIVDLMNGTRGFWSKHCCKYRRHNEYVFIGSAVGTILISIIFYVLTKVCAVMKLPVVLKQNRFAGSFAQASGH